MPDPANDILTQNESNQSNKDLVSELVGDGKKFKTIEDLAQGKLQADIHIKRLEEEARVMRDTLAGAKAIDDVLQAIQAKTSLDGNPSKIGEPEDKSTLQSPGLSEEQVAKIVAEKMTGFETAKQKDANRVKSNELMTQLFGEKAKEKFESKASSPALRQALVTLAETSPAEFISLFEEKKNESIVDLSGSKNLNTLNVNTSNSNAEPGTQLYYNKLRKEKPKLYYSAAVQLEMHAAALKDPAKYFGH